MSVKAEFFERDLGYKRILKEVRKMNKSYTGVGLYGNGGDESENLAARAAVLEYGTRSSDRIPERPFMRLTFDRYNKETTKLIETWFNRIIKLRGTVIMALRNIGEFYTGKTKETIIEGPFEANKPRTTAKKGSSKPLIDTGQMRASVTHKEFIRGR